MATTFISQMNVYASIFICFVFHWIFFFVKGFFLNCFGFPLSTAECCSMQSYFNWEQMCLKSASAPKVPFAPTGRAFFIYIGEHEASKRGKIQTRHLLEPSGNTAERHKA